MENNIYDNSNISESYAGVTTPLTFSFVKRVYKGVYEHFSILMGVGRKTINSQEDIFSNMVEYIGGRIYYNLNNWYKMLSFFPGYKFSGEFMEKMMGVERRNSQKIEKTQGTFLRYLLYFPKTIFQSIKISYTFYSLTWEINRFNDYFDKIYQDIEKISLKNMNARELRDHYLYIEAKLLSKWKIPIANDFAVMVSAGLSDKLFKRWLGSKNAYAHMKTNINKPLVSLNPGDEIMRIVNLINNDKRMKQIFLKENAQTVFNKIKHDAPETQISKEIDYYLDKFGSRMPNELKLETLTLKEAPVELIVLLKKIIENEGNQEKSYLANVEPREHDKLPWPKRLILNKLVIWAGNSMYRREETRFRRTLIFGHVRKIFLAIGSCLKERSMIEKQRDIFFLTMEEIFSLDEGKCNKKNYLKSIIKKRKQKQKRWRNFELPRRIETQKNVVTVEKDLIEGNLKSESVERKKTAGDVASKPTKEKVFTGVALTMKEFDSTADFKGKILITKQTDPGWTMIFPLLKGIVVEKGGMLSHAAVVARELRIPCIIGARGATCNFSTGERVAIDLELGSITKIDRNNNV
ncbi:MAG: PEP-utilizing enzyme [Patescibacteria group bacterium]